MISHNLVLFCPESKAFHVHMVTSMRVQPLPLLYIPSCDIYMNLEGLSFTLVEFQLDLPEIPATCLVFMVFDANKSNNNL